VRGPILWAKWKKQELGNSTNNSEECHVVADIMYLYLTNRQNMYSVTMGRIPLTIVAMEKQ
jgi:hypothetical protein